MINPAVAGHGGFVELIDVQDNRVYLQMGGGCQGCGTADVTLKSGIERADQGRAPGGRGGPRHHRPLRRARTPTTPPARRSAPSAARSTVDVCSFSCRPRPTAPRTSSTPRAALGVDLVCASERPEHLRGAGPRPSPDARLRRSRAAPPPRSPVRASGARSRRGRGGRPHHRRRRGHRRAARPPGQSVAAAVAPPATST